MAETHEISDRITPWLRLLPLTAWPLIAGTLLLLNAAGLLPAPHRVPVPGEALLRVVWFIFLVPLLVLPFVAVWGWRLTRVRSDGIVLQASDGFLSDTIALSYIGGISEDRSRLLRIVTLSCDRDTPWGMQIRFLAPLRGDVPAGEEHPTVTALKAAVRRARP